MPCIDQIVAPRAQTAQHRTSDDVPRAHARAAATVYIYIYIWGSWIKSNACGAAHVYAWQHRFPTGLHACCRPIEYVKPWASATCA